MVNLRVTARPILVFLVGESLKSTRHRYTPWSCSRRSAMTRCTASRSTTRDARGPNQDGEDQRRAWVSGRPRASTLCSSARGRSGGGAALRPGSGVARGSDSSPVDGHSVVGRVLAVPQQHERRFPGPGVGRAGAGQGRRQPHGRGHLQHGLWKRHEKI